LRANFGAVSRTLVFIKSALCLGKKPGHDFSHTKQALVAVERGEDSPGVCRDEDRGLISFYAQRIRDGQLIQA
jgi:hypothetical protein